MRKKSFGLEFGPNGAKSDSKLGFLPFSQVWLISFPLNCMDDSLELCLTTSFIKKNHGNPNLGLTDLNQGPFGGELG